MAALTPASPADLPPLGSLVADEPFWRYPLAALGGEGVAHLRVWLTTGPEPGYLASSPRPEAQPPSLSPPGTSGPSWPAGSGTPFVLLEHTPAPEFGEGLETLDLVRIGADGSPHWSRVWPTPEENPHHAGLELWMAAHGHQIVSRPASAFDWCQDEGG